MQYGYNQLLPHHETSKGSAMFGFGKKKSKEGTEEQLHETMNFGGFGGLKRTKPPSTTEQATRSSGKADLSILDEVEKYDENIFVGANTLLTKFRKILKQAKRKSPKTTSNQWLMVRVSIFLKSRLFRHISSTISIKRLSRINIKVSHASFLQLKNFTNLLLVGKTQKPSKTFPTTF